MKRTIAFVIIIFLLTTLFVACKLKRQLIVETSKEERQKPLKSVVRIVVTPDSRSLLRMYNIATGFVIKEGYVLTCFHSLLGSFKAERPYAIKVYIEEKPYNATIVKKDAAMDYVVLRINPKEALPAPVMTTGEYDIMDRVYCAGFPFADIYSRTYKPRAIPITLTSGVISGLNRKIRYRKKLFENMIQIDAYCQEGNSGGPVFNEQMKAIGMVNFVYSYSDGKGNEVWNGATFASPISIILNQISLKKKK